MEYDYTIGRLLIRLCNDCFTGFFVYTLIFFGFLVLRKKENIRAFDDCACLVAVFSGIAFFLFWIGDLSWFWLAADEKSRLALSERFHGPYGFSLWLQPVFYGCISQLLWIRKVRRVIVLRLIVALLLFFDFEKCTIIIISLHRDYLPGFWLMTSYSSEFWVLISLFTKTAEFCVLALIVYWIRRKTSNFAV